MGLDASGLILDGYGPIWKDSVSIQDYFGPELDESGPILDGSGSNQYWSWKNGDPSWMGSGYPWMEPYMYSFRIRPDQPYISPNPT